MGASVLRTPTTVTLPPTRPRHGDQYDGCAFIAEYPERRASAPHVPRSGTADGQPPTPPSSTPWPHERHRLGNGGLCARHRAGDDANRGRQGGCQIRRPLSTRRRGHGTVSTTTSSASG